MSMRDVLRVLVLATLLPLAAHAALREDIDYQRLGQAQRTDHPGKIEVLEFFSYGCPHCYHMHPYITKWAAQLPANAVFVRIPSALGRREWGALSRAYYALEATGDLQRLDTALFDAIHKDGVPLFDEANLTAWASQRGIPADKFRQAYNSAGVSAKALRAEELARLYQIDKVPTITVNGRYVVLANEAKTQEDVLAIASQVIEKAQTEK